MFDGKKGCTTNNNNNIIYDYAGNPFHNKELCGTNE